MTIICMNYAVFSNLYRGAIKIGEHKALGKENLPRWWAVSKTYAFCSKRGSKSTILIACISKSFWKILKHAVIV